MHGKDQRCYRRVRQMKGCVLFLRAGETPWLGLEYRENICAKTNNPLGDSGLSLQSRNCCGFGARRCDHGPTYTEDGVPQIPATLRALTIKGTPVGFCLAWKGQ